ncbi:MAG TPA: hypothetical protein VN603_06795 [Candidatus Acidoferrales bacterium]|nr:hypothetical protein [Candidatus Acidoferrales bacterium]
MTSKRFYELAPLGVAFAMILSVLAHQPAGRNSSRGTLPPAV